MRADTFLFHHSYRASENSCLLTSAATVLLKYFKIKHTTHISFHLYTKKNIAEQVYVKRLNNVHIIKTCFTYHTEAPY